MPNTSITKASPGQQGFTLIEIIAVLVILGILAAVATPRFMDLQDEARDKALEGAVAAAQSQVSMEYARQILAEDGNESSAWEALDDATICDKVKTDGFDENFDWATCEHGDDNTFVIKAKAGDASATGNFIRPNGD